MPGTSKRPDFSLERAAATPVAGVDEVGRGPLAGPVVAAAAILLRHDLPPPLTAINDSKKLSANRREDIFAALHDLVRAGDASIAVGQCSVDEIDQLNILQASLTAMARAVVALGIVPASVLVDGNRLPQLPCPGQAVVKGDQRSISIAAASIIAKVTRDRIMAELDSQTPGYGWAHNAGYPTPEHLDALKKLGATGHHRKSFAPVRRILNAAG